MHFWPFWPFGQRLRIRKRRWTASAWPSLECSLGSLSSHLSKGLGCWEVMSTYCSCVLKSSRGDVQEQHRVKMVTGGGRACNSQFASDAWFAFPN